MTVGDTVQIVPGDQRTVDRIEWPGTYMSPGVQAVRVWWAGRDRPNTLAADKELPLVAQPVIVTVHLWQAEKHGDGTWGWWCPCGWQSDGYPDRDGAEDAADMHAEREG